MSVDRADLGRGDRLAEDGIETAQAFLFRQVRRVELAEREYKEALKDTPMAHFYLGNLYFDQKILDKAEREYRTALRAVPEQDAAPIYNNLAWLLHSRGENSDEAVNLAHKAVNLATPDQRPNFQNTLDAIVAARKQGRG